MAATIISSSVQKRVKDSFAASPVLGLTVRANGEEIVQVIDYRGTMYPAYIIAPTVAPTVADSGAGNLTNGQYISYVYCYAATTAFPFVENVNSMGGSIAPRSNPSPASTIYNITGTGNRQLTITCTKTTAIGVDKIWIFRTTMCADAQTATLDATAGNLYFIGAIANNGVAGTVTFVDNVLLDSADIVELDNYPCPQFHFVVYEDPFFWGFANHPFTANASWTTGGVITLTGTDTWFTGRNGQPLTLSTITTGGADGKGSFVFKYTDATHGVITTDGTTAATITAGSGVVTLQGPGTTLYRSKYRNPFSWGTTATVGTVSVPSLYTFKVGGGIGTAIASVPNYPLLKLDVEYPSRCYTLNLKAAGTVDFEPSLRTISDFSISSHFSQFRAMTAHGQSVLWGIDYTTFAILQSDGMTQVPISQDIPRILRQLTTNKSTQLLAHGVYDPLTEMNCIWVTTANAVSLVDYMIYQHVPTGAWGFVNDKDVLCSATLEDTSGGMSKKTFVGTQSGLFGQAFVANVYNNWLPTTGMFTGVISTGTTTTITQNTGTFNTTNDGIIGNWVLVTDANGGSEQYARISARTGTQLTFDLFRSYTYGFTTQFSPTPTAGYLFYIGLIECNLIKYFDFQQPSADKRLLELWLTQQNTDPTTAGTLIRYYRERSSTYFAQVAMLQNTSEDDILSDTWFTKDQLPAELIKCLGIQIINRGYQAWRFFNMAIKLDLA